MLVPLQFNLPAGLKEHNAWPLFLEILSKGFRSLIGGRGGSEYFIRHWSVCRLKFSYNIECEYW